MNFFQKIKDGLLKTKQAMISRFQKVINSFTKIDEDLFEELEETMIMSDIGVDTSVEICERLRKRVKERGVTDPNEIMGLIQEIISEMMGTDTEIDTSTKPSIIMVIGVNGVGKTTTIGKLCYQYRQQGKKVLVAAADTFRAAAIDQLEIWTKRAGVELVKHSEGSDPGAVIFDAISAGKARGADIIICDTAGRLHNKKNLMNELSKINRIVSQQAEGCARETLLVLDATTGQNAVNQAKMFSETADITGIVLTKLDGTAKGGIVISIKNELNIPVKLIGVGEKIDDLQPFNSKDFVKALFDMDFQNAEKSNYDRIIDSGEVTTKEDFSIVPDVPVIEDTPKSKSVKKKSTDDTPKVEPVKEEPIIDNNPKVEPVKEEPIIDDTPKVEPIKEKPIIDDTPKVEPVKEELIIDDTPKAEPIKEETNQVIGDSKLDKIKQLQQSLSNINDTDKSSENIQEDDALPNVQEVEPIPDDYYNQTQKSETYYDDNDYYYDDEYYDDEYYDENDYYYDDEYYDEEPIQEVQEKPQKKESFFSKLFGKKNKDKSKDNPKKKDKNNKKKK